ncbi:MAG TPA: 30S ribosomal protein S6 [Planctomycetota bacterium]|nr:30S ribosomal protein S6 [Planctomycetota bacterium]
MVDETQAAPAADVPVSSEPGVTYVKVDLPPVPPEMLKTTRVYEVLVLFDPTEGQKAWDRLLEFVKGLIEQRHGGLVLKTENWAESRKLSYEVKGLRRGSYMLIYFRAKPATINALNGELKLDDKVVRHLIVQHEKMPDALTGRVRQRIVDEFEEDDFRRRDDEWGEDDYGYDDE